jgi:hypothetical protein
MNQRRLCLCARVALDFEAASEGVRAAVHQRSRTPAPHMRAGVLGSRRRHPGEPTFARTQVTGPHAMIEETWPSGSRLAPALASPFAIRPIASALARCPQDHTQGGGVFRLCLDDHWL